jgi:hypothetical protein
VFFYRNCQGKSDDDEDVKRLKLQVSEARALVWVDKHDMAMLLVDVVIRLHWPHSMNI